MAVLKKNQVNQILFTMVDKTSFADIETSLASGFTVKRFGVNHGSAATNVSTLSRIVSKVGSGIYKLSLEANACNYDYVALRIAHASAATQILVYEMRTYDDTDTFSLLSDFESNMTSRVPKEVASKSLLSDVNSNLLSYLAGISDTLSDTNSKLVVMSGIQSDLYSLLSDVNSNFSSRIPKEVANASQLLLVKSLVSDVDSQLNVTASKVDDMENRISDLESLTSDAHSAATKGNSMLLVGQSHLSNIYSMLSDFQSDFGSRVPKEVASKSLLSDVNSDLASKIGGITVTIGASDVSDIASAVAAGITTLGPSDISDIASAVWAYSTRKITSLADVSLCDSDLSDIRSAITAGGGALTASNISDIASAVWGYGTKEVSLGASDLSDIRSAVLSLSAMLSDTHSAATKANSMLLVNQSSVSNIYSLLSDVDSNFQSRIPKEVASKSLLSDVNSNLLSYLGGISDTISNIHGDVADLSAVLSDFYSDFQSRVPKELASKSLLSDVNSNLLSYLTGMSDQISNVDSALDSQFSDVKSGVTEARKILRNKMKITSATGAAKLYDDDDSIMLSNAITADATSTVRTRLA